MGQRVGSALEGRCIRTLSPLFVQVRIELNVRVHRTIQSQSPPSTIYQLQKEERPQCRCESVLAAHSISTLNVIAKRLIEAISPSHGRALIYVWGIEQDGLSKRSIPTSAGPDGAPTQGRDVFVPWVLSSQNAGKANVQVRDTEDTLEPKVFNRYYHMFAQGELRALVEEAALELGLEVGSEVDQQHDSGKVVQGLEVIQDGWERSNYYVELKRWNASLKA